MKTINGTILEQKGNDWFMANDSTFVWKGETLYDRTKVWEDTKTNKKYTRTSVNGHPCFRPLGR